jgi:hypothetical protein
MEVARPPREDYLVTIKRRLDSQDWKCASGLCRFAHEGNRFREGHQIVIGSDGHALLHAECATVAIVNLHGRLVRPKR